MRREAQTVYLRVLSLDISLALFLSFRLKKKKHHWASSNVPCKKEGLCYASFWLSQFEASSSVFRVRTQNRTPRRAGKNVLDNVFFFSCVCVCVCVYECSGVLFSYCCSSSCVIWGFGKSLQRYRCAKRNRHRNLRNLEDRSKKARITSTKSPHTREVKRCERKGKTRQNKKRQSFLVFRYHMLCVGAIRF